MLSLACTEHSTSAVVVVSVGSFIPMKAVKTHVNILPFLPLPALDIVQLLHTHDLARGDCDNESAYTPQYANGRHRQVVPRKMWGEQEGKSLQ